MSLTLKQIRLLTPRQRLITECETTNGFGAACRTAYKGRKEIIAAGDYDCDVTQDSLSQTVTVSIKKKETIDETI